MELIVLPQAASTNDEARALARAGAPGGTAVLAARQSAGRGRLGRAFCSPEGGLYLSCVLRPVLPPERLPLLTPLAAVAVCRAVRACAGVECQIKWVNDLLLGGKKLCGILCEREGEAVVCGVGLNLRTPPGGWPPELCGKAAALPAPVGREELARAIVRELLALCARLPDTGFLAEYRARSAVLGRTVRVCDPAGDYEALAEGIDGTAGLCLLLPDGSRRTLRAGEVSIVL